MTETTVRYDIDTDQAPDEDSDETMVLVVVEPPGGTAYRSAIHIPGNADGEQIADALIRCVNGVASAHGWATFMSIRSRMMQETQP